MGILQQTFYHELLNVHIFLYNGTALIGIIAVILMYKGNVVVTSDRSYGIGIVLGIASLCLTALTQEGMVGEVKFVMIIDYLFIAGVIGGWRNSLITFIFVSFSRFVFGGAANFSSALIDFAFTSTGSLLGHRLIARYGLKKLRIKHIFYLVMLRFILGESSIFFLSLFNMITPESYRVLAIRRLISSFSSNILVIFGLFTVLKAYFTREEQFFTDPISSLDNKKALEKYLGQDNRQKAILLVTIDNTHQLTQMNGYKWFENFYKKFGHELVLIHQRPSNLKFEPKLFAFSDHSFAIVLLNTDKNRVFEKGIAHNLFKELLSFSNKEKNKLAPQLSIGVINIYANMNLVHFLRTLSFFEAEQSGTVRFFEHDVVKQMLLEEYIHSKILDWNRHGGVPVWLQPKVNLVTNKCYGAEALLRIQDGGGKVNPQSVIAIAEKYKLRVDFEWAIVKEVMEYISKLPEEMSDISISINLTPDMFSIPDFAPKFINIMKVKGISSHRIIIEVIETSKFKNSDIVQNNIFQLFEEGIVLSLDDFGTGYSSIYLLSQYNFDELKLDYSITSNLDNPRMYAAVQLSIETANKYNAILVAEGIETKDQKNKLVDMGVTNGQGYLFGRAMPFDEFIKYVSNNRDVLAV